jgi:hypothetical protein
MFSIQVTSLFFQPFNGLHLHLHVNQRLITQYAYTCIFNFELVSMYVIYIVLF